MEKDDDQFLLIANKRLQDLINGRVGHQIETLTLQGLQVLSFKKGLITCVFIVPKILADTDGNWHIGAIATQTDVLGAIVVGSSTGQVQATVNFNITCFSSVKIENVNKKKLYKTFRSFAVALLGLVQDLKKTLRDDHIAKLKETPFGKLFMVFHDGTITKTMLEKHSHCIIKVLQAYSKKRRKFKFGKNKWVELTPEDVAVTFGLPVQGKIVAFQSRTLRQNAIEASPFMQRYWKKEAKITTVIVLATLNKIINKEDNESVEDVARLIVIYMVMTMFVSSGASGIGWSFPTHVESFDAMWSVAWATSIHKELMTKVHKWDSKSPFAISGCVIQLLYFLCEHVAICKPVNVHSFPRIAKWSMEKLNEKMTKDFQLENVETESVMINLKLSEEETRLISHVSAPSELDCLRKENEDLKKENAQLKAENTHLKKLLKIEQLNVEKESGDSESDEEESGEADEEEEKGEIGEVDEKGEADEEVESESNEVDEEGEADEEEESKSDREEEEKKESDGEEEEKKESDGEEEEKKESDGEEVEKKESDGEEEKGEEEPNSMFKKVKERERIKKTSTIYEFEDIKKRKRKTKVTEPAGD